mmetsp:Transcript_85695/g.239497  ORF Transcript_85695/g.239497 Transcript_85695/m.239497 type:complete len:276 (+) Transcript_85695:179-1006(+)
MPHYQILGRLRSWPLHDLKRSHDEQVSLRHREGVCACVVEVMDIFGGVIFLVGSVCFLPEVSKRLVVFLTGCALFILGGVIYAGLSTFTLVETVRVRGWQTLEACENALYLVGSIVFLAGTVLYWPEETHYMNMEWMKEFSLGVYFNLFTSEFEGTLLFIFGSLLFAMAAFVNGLSQGQNTGQPDEHGGLLAATTSLYMAGSLLFVVGSVAFLPDLGCSEQMLCIGAWCFIVGSALYVIGGSISLVRVTRQMQQCPERKHLFAQLRATAAREYAA